MPAITDPDELAHVLEQLSPRARAPEQTATPPAITGRGGAIVDPDEIEHIRQQLGATPQVPTAATPALPVPPPAPAGPVLQAPPDRGWLGTADDTVRMITAGIPFSDRAVAGLQTMTGTGLPGADYATNLENERRRTEWVASQNPKLAKALGFAGGAASVLATAPSAALTAPTLAGKTAYGAATGAGYGALQGASETRDLTNLPEAGRNMAGAAAIGALTGAGMPIMGAGVGATYERGANAVTGGVPGMSRGAAAQLRPALAADTLPEVQAKLGRLGPEGMLADAGPALLGKAQGASLYNDNGRSILANALKNRDLGTVARINADVNAALGPSASPVQITQAIQKARGYEHQALPAIFETAPPVDTSGVLSTIGMGLNKSVGPESAVLNRARDYLTKPAFDPEGNPIRVPVTDAQTLQNAKMALDMLIDRGDPGLGVPAGAISKAQGAVGQVRRELNQHLREQVPGYGQVMDNSSKLARQADALEQGMSGVLQGGQSALHPADLAAQLSGASPEMLAGMRAGTRAHIENALGTKANDLQALKGELQLASGTAQGVPSWNQQKLAQIWGERPIQDLAAAIDRNAAFRDTFNKVVENSQTAQRTSALNSMKPGADTGGIPLINPNANLAGMLATGVKKGVGAIVDQFRADPTRNYGEVARVLSAQGPQRDAYLNALAGALMRRSANAETARKIGNTSSLATALIANRLANDQWRGPASKNP